MIRLDSYQSSNSSLEMSNELATTLASIQEFMVGMSRRLDQIESSHQDYHPVDINTDEIVSHASLIVQVLRPRTSHGVSFHLSNHYETAPPLVAIVPPPIVPITDDTKLVEMEVRVERLESRMR